MGVAITVDEANIRKGIRNTLERYRSYEGEAGGKILENREQQASAEQLLFSVLTEDGGNQELLQRQFAEKIQSQKGHVISMFLIQSENILESSFNQTMEILKGRLDASCLTSFFIFKLPYENQILVMISDSGGIRSLMSVFKTWIMKELQKKGEFLISYEVLQSVSGLKDTLKQMREYLSYTFAFQDRCIIDRELVQNLSFERVEYPEYLEHGIKRDIRNGRMEGIRRNARKFEEAVIQSREKPEVIKNHTVRFIMTVLNTARDLMKNKDIEALYQYLLNDMMKTNIREVFLNNYWKVINMVADAGEEETSTGNGMILNVIEFIRQNYKKEISLSDVADLVGITPEYLSKLFAREMGINFSVFLREFRVSAAKRLLATGNYKIREVAEMVGYKDTKYFNKVFRSITGVSPSDYKKVV